MTKITKDLLRERLAELKDLKAGIELELEPLDKRREKILAKLQPLEAELRDLDKERRAAREPLFDIDNEISTITRLLPGDRTIPAVESKEE